MEKKGPHKDELTTESLFNVALYFLINSIADSKYKISNNLDRTS